MSTFFADELFGSEFNGIGPIVGWVWSGSELNSREIVTNGERYFGGHEFGMW